MLSVPVITISGYLMTSPIWMSLWDLEETHSLLYSSPSDFVPELYPMKPCKITEEKHLHTKLMAIAMTRKKKIQMKSRVEVLVVKGSIEEYPESEFHRGRALPLPSCYARSPATEPTTC